MKIPSVCKIEACVSQDATRPTIQNVHLDCEAKLLVATDGTMMALLPVELGEHDVTGYVTPEALAMARKIVTKKGSIDIACNGALAISSGPTFTRPAIDGENSLGSYPNYKQVIPSEPGSIRIAFDVTKLKAICDAMGCTKVAIQFTPEVTAKCKDDLTIPASVIEVLPSDSKVIGARGLLMPLRLT